MNNNNDHTIEDWKFIWEKKGFNIQDITGLEDLIAIDGFNLGTGKFPMGSWSSFVNKVRSRLNIIPGDKVLEIGCGSGAFLYPLLDSGIEIYGIDYADNMIKVCQKVMGSGIFEVAQADSIPFANNLFDVIISHSVFIYFPSLEYAEKVIKEISRTLKTKGSVGILDVNDLDKKNDFIAYRKKKLGEEEYMRLYKNLNQQFYSKEWFEDMAEKYGFGCETEAQSISNYGNSEFRFNVFMKRA
jgi:ubiquinone/menaquinone biosynthesis C-methylase UbiE